MTSSLPGYNQRFELMFENGHRASAVRIQTAADIVKAMQVLGFTSAMPTLFVSGGAGGMSENDRQITHKILEAVGQFARDQGAVVVDGGTESGIMQMLGEVRDKTNGSFLLIGVAPLGKVSFPGYQNPNEEAFLEDSHSHFVLVDGDDWGAESPTIVALTNHLSGNGTRPAVGLLINGGKIAMQEVYLASTHEHKIPILVLEGSGRAADDISSAYRSGRTSQRILQAILRGGDIQLVGTSEGPEGMLEKLSLKFK
jgi:hypothetical protein